MHNFKDLGIKPAEGNIRGLKIKVKELLGKEIIVYDKFKLINSKYGNNKKCLHMQIQYEGNFRMVFTTAHALIDVVLQAKEKNGFPFKTVIKRQNDRYEFT